jgi:uncharacterized protein YcbX
VRVTGLALTPVKGMRLQAVGAVRIDRHGVRENRRFLLVDERDRMINAKQAGELQTLIARYDDERRRLEVEFPDGRVISERLRLGEPIEVGFFSRRASVRPVLGSFSEAISAHVGRSLRLAEAGAEGTVDRGARGAVTLISRASLARLAEQAALDRLDSRRFRMLIEIDGVTAHAEDGWIGARVTVGGAVIRPGGHVGRCLITSRNPETGVIDLPTLELLGAYRRGLASTEALPFGIYAEVLEPGRVAVGDPVAVQDG